MKNITKNTIILMIGLLTIAMISGNVLMAQERGGVIAASDVARISGESHQSTAGNTPSEETSSAGVISNADYAFASKPFVEGAESRKPVDSNESAGVITVADFSYVNGGNGSVSAADCDPLSNALACADK